VRELAGRMAAEGVGALVVIECDQVHGIVSERDVGVAIAAGKQLDATTAAEIVGPRPTGCCSRTRRSRAGPGRNNLRSRAQSLQLRFGGVGKQGGDRSHPRRPTPLQETVSGRSGRDQHHAPVGF
jgi:hypothetical protein